MPSRAKGTGTFAQVGAFWLYTGEVFVLAQGPLVWMVSTGTEGRPVWKSGLVVNLASKEVERVQLLMVPCVPRSVKVAHCPLDWRLTPLALITALDGTTV